MEGLLRKLEENLLLKNYSKQTVKSYLFIIGKHLEFSKDLGINPGSAKKFVLKRLNNGKPSPVSHGVFALRYFFKEISLKPQSKTLKAHLTIYNHGRKSEKSDN